MRPIAALHLLKIAIASRREVIEFLSPGGLLYLLFRENLHRHRER